MIGVNAISAKLIAHTILRTSRYINTYVQESRANFISHCYSGLFSLVTLEIVALL